MQRKETVREFINKRSSGAWITFEFDVDKVTDDYFKQYWCSSVDEFLTRYGTMSEHILDDYVVISTTESILSQSQGQTIWMTLQKKSDYMKTLEPVSLSPFDVENIVDKLEHIKSLVFSCDSVSESDIEEINSIINMLEKGN